MSEPIIVTFVEDEAFYLEAHKNNPRNSRYLIVSLGVVAVVGLIFFSKAWIEYNHGNARWWEELMFAAVSTPFILAYMSPVGRRWLLKKQLKKVLKSPPGMGRLEFGPTGFTSTGAFGESSFHPWQRIHQIVERLNGILVYFTKDTYFWVPRRLFEDQAEYERVIALIASNVRDFKRFQA